MRPETASFSRWDSASSPKASSCSGAQRRPATACCGPRTAPRKTRATMGTSRSGGTLGVTGFADDRNAMTTTQARPDRFRDGLIQPFLVVAAVAGTAVDGPYRDILIRSVALALLLLVSISAAGCRLPGRSVA